jgi:hypothetical protein
VAPDFINDPAHWRQRAEEMRTLADDMRDLESKERMLRNGDKAVHEQGGSLFALP